MSEKSCTVYVVPGVPPSTPAAKTPVDVVATRLMMGVIVWGWVDEISPLALANIRFDRIWLSIEMPAGAGFQMIRP